MNKYFFIQPIVAKFKMAKLTMNKVNMAKLNNKL